MTNTSALGTLFKWRALLNLTVHYISIDILELPAGTAKNPSLNRRYKVLNLFNHFSNLVVITFKKMKPMF